LQIADSCRKIAPGREGSRITAAFFSAVLRYAKKFLSQNGMVVMDEAFVRVGVKCRNPLYRPREAVLKEISVAGFDILAEKTADSALQEAENLAMFKAIKRRADALAARLPHLSSNPTSRRRSRSSMSWIRTSSTSRCSLRIRDQKTPAQGCPVAAPRKSRGKSG
jgi:hypothetical protein